MRKIGLQLLIRCCFFALVGVILLAVLGSPARAQLRPAHGGLTATADNASTAYWNPAGMSRLDRTEIVSAPILAVSHSQFEVDAETSVGGGDADESLDVIGVPSLYYTRPISENFRLGMALTIPAGVGSDYGSDWAGRYYTQKSTLFLVSATPAVSYRVNNWLSVGAGVALMYVSFETEAAINNRLDSLPDGKVKLETSGLSAGGVFSALFELSPETRFGVVYRSEVDADLEGVPEFINLGPVLGQAMLLNGILARELEIGLNVPQQVQAGLYHNLTDRWNIMLDFAWINMEEFGSLDLAIGENSTNIDAGYQDMYGGSIVAEYELCPEWTVAAGFAYLSAPVDDDNRSLSLPMDRIWMVGAGFSHPLNEKRRIHVNLNYYDTGSAPIDVGDPASPTGRVKGEFSGKFAVGLEFGFQWGR
jgi:long-chain fatty acid transport protein